MSNGLIVIKPEMMSNSTPNPGSNIVGLSLTQDSNELRTDLLDYSHNSSGNLLEYVLNCPQSAASLSAIDRCLGGLTGCTSTTGSFQPLETPMLHLFTNTPHLLPHPNSNHQNMPFAIQQHLQLGLDHLQVALHSAAAANLIYSSSGPSSSSCLTPYLGNEGAGGPLSSPSCLAYLTAVHHQQASIPPVVVPPPPPPIVLEAPPPHCLSTRGRRTTCHPPLKEPTT
uniref:Uncharacterized protein n=1 Tax=Ditylenchus dipsaci TaxID=166011 RepID=A0A915D605_9BILA